MSMRDMPAARLYAARVRARRYMAERGITEVRALYPAPMIKVDEVVKVTVGPLISAGPPVPFSKLRIV